MEGRTGERGRVALRMAREPTVTEGRSEGRPAKTTEGRSLKPLRSMKEQRAQREREW